MPNGGHPTVNYTKQKIIAGGSATIAWIISGLYLYLSTAGASLFSWSALGFFAIGTFVAALVFGGVTYGMLRGFAKFLVLVREPRRRGDTRRVAAVITIFGGALTVVNVVLVFITAGWVFHQVVLTRLPAEYFVDRDNFGIAMKSFYEASQLDRKMKAGSSSVKIDPDTEAKIQELIKTGIDHGQTVSEKFLAYLDPELPQYFGPQLLRGHELVLEGRQSGSATSQQIGIGLLDQFYKTFMPAHQDKILKKIE